MTIALCILLLVSVLINAKLCATIAGKEAVIELYKKRLEDVRSIWSNRK